MDLHKLDLPAVSPSEIYILLPQSLRHFMHNGRSLAEGYLKLHQVGVKID